MNSNTSSILSLQKIANEMDEKWANLLSYKEKDIEPSKELTNSINELEKELCDPRWKNIINDSINEANPKDISTILYCATAIGHKINAEKLLSFLFEDKSLVCIYKYLLQMESERANTIDFFISNFDILSQSDVDMLHILFDFETENEILTLFATELLQSENQYVRVLANIYLYKNGKVQSMTHYYPQKIEISNTDIYLFRTIIAGTFYRDESELYSEIVDGKKLKLVCDDFNRFDKMAIMCICESGFVCGFISRESNEILNRLIKGNMILYAIVTSFDLKEKQIVANVYMKK